MKKILIILFFLVLTISTVHAETLGGGYTACITKGLFDEWVTALVKNDKRAMNYLLKNGCIITKAGIPISVLDRKWSGKVKVRAYVKDQAIILWTYQENIQK